MNPAQTFPIALQNLDVFTLLGVGGTPEEQQQLINEFQDIIWQDVVDTELMPILSEEEMARATAILDDESKDLAAKRDAFFVMLNEHLSNLDELLAQHTMALKQELMEQRLAGMKEYFQNQPENLGKLNQAGELMLQGRHDEAVRLMNEVGQTVQPQ